MLIILLPWIRAATDKHPTCVAANVGHSFMATAPDLYSAVTHLRGWRSQHRLTGKHLQEFEWKVSESRGVAQRQTTSVSFRTLAVKVAAFFK